MLSSPPPLPSGHLLIQVHQHEMHEIQFLILFFKHQHFRFNCIYRTAADTHTCACADAQL